MSSATANLLEKVSPRAGPLIITVFGDSIAPRGGSIWLGSLIELMRPLGLSERLVRTGVYRLSQEGWLKARQNGRRSFYTITDAGLDTFADADARIYAAHPIPWDGKWIIVQLTPQTPSKHRKEIRDLLTWRGFGQLSPTTMIKPGSDTHSVNQLLKSVDLHNSSIVFISNLDQKSDQRTIVENGWNLQELSNSYRNLSHCFSFAREKPLEEKRQAFVIRTLLIHQYRRILLKDPQLPKELLPDNWNGEQARKLVADSYKLLTNGTDAFVEETIQHGDQSFPQPKETYHNRFHAN